MGKGGAAGQVEWKDETFGTNGTGGNLSERGGGGDE